MTTKTAPKYETKNEKSTAFCNAKLSETAGTKVLTAEKVTTVNAVKRELNGTTTRLVSKKQMSQVIEPLTFVLEETTAEALRKRRSKKIPTFVLKEEGKLYYTEIPKRMSLVGSNLLGTVHQCARAGKECRRLSAASDELRGCAKVRNGSRRIEIYPWIETGYETFATNNKDCFVVVKCLHYEKCPPRRKMSQAEVSKAKLGLASFVWDDVKDIYDLRRRKSEVRNRYKYF